MPTYGKSKAKDILRRALTGKGRTDKVIAHRTSRHNMKQDVTELVKDPDLFDEYSDDDKELDAEIHGMRYDRGRGYRSLKRWAKAVTKGEPDARVAQLRDKLPKTEAGEEALKMVKWDDAFRNRNELKYSYNYGVRYKQSYYETYETRKAFLVELMSFRPWLHGKLNLAIKRAHETKYHKPIVSYRCLNFDAIDPVTGKPGRPEIKHRTSERIYVGAKHPRLLGGAGDIDAFLDDLVNGVPWEGEMPMVVSPHGKKAKPYPAFHGKRDIHYEWTMALDAFMKKYPKGGDEP